VAACHFANAAEVRLPKSPVGLDISRNPCLTRKDCKATTSEPVAPIERLFVKEVAGTAVEEAGVDTAAEGVVTTGRAFSAGALVVSVDILLVALVGGVFLIVTRLSAPK
jgi:hypothetical protein